MDLDSMSFSKLCGLIAGGEIWLLIWVFFYLLLWWLWRISTKHWPILCWWFWGMIMFIVITQELNKKCRMFGAISPACPVYWPLTHFHLLGSSDKYFAQHFIVHFINYQCAGKRWQECAHGRFLCDDLCLPCICLILFELSKHDAEDN